MAQSFIPSNETPVNNQEHCKENCSTRKTRVVQKQKIVGLQDEKRRRSRKRHWKPVQNQRYVQFLRRNGKLFQKNREDKRLMKINILMSNFVKTKSSTQCRSHHQKMLIHYGSIDSIINHLEVDSFTPITQKQTIQKVESVELIEDQKQEKQEVKLWDFINEDCWGYRECLGKELFFDLLQL